MELPPDDVVFGHTAAMTQLRERLTQAVAAEVPVLIAGESGSGKEVLARLIHQRSPRAAAPFVKIHCPAIPPALLESELFGHEPGAFTGAVERRIGRIEQASGGTLFLDEISDLGPGGQAKLLELLQDGLIWPIGGSAPRSINARIVCATSRDLWQDCQTGRFRIDLYFRIGVVELTSPPLRERREDLPGLVEYLRRVLNAAYHRSARPLSADALQLLAAHTWPGNIRELENLMSRFVLFGSEELFATDLLPRPPAAHAPVPLREVARRAGLEAQRQIILSVLHGHHWSRKETAKALRISYRALLYKLRDTGIPTRRSLGCSRPLE
ncbi:MAG: sigma 54-interacting transcriptional regulator [Terriglobales bacterium]